MTLTIGLLALSPICHAQPTTLRFQHLNELDGLKKDLHAFMRKDSRGFLWISATQGLYRYDGFELKFYAGDNSQPGAMLGKIVHSDFFEDGQGNIWFATYSGINCYLREKDAFTSLRLKKETGADYEINYTILQLEGDSVLWVKAEDVIFRYNIQTKKQRPIIAGIRGMRFAVDQDLDGRIKTVYSCPWLNKQGIEIISIDQETQEAVCRSSLQKGIAAFPERPLEVAMALVECDTLVWLFTSSGLLSLNPQKPDDATTYPLPSGESGVMIDGAFYKDRWLFITTKDVGLWLFDRIAKKFVHSFQKSAADNGSPTSNSLSEVYIDEEDHLWISNIYETGIDHAWLAPNRFHYPDFNGMDPAPIVQALVADDHHRLWCATAFHGIFVFDRWGKQLRHFPYAREGENSNDGRKLNAITRLSKDANGILWALSAQYAYRYDAPGWRLAFTSPGNKLYDLIHIDSTQKLLATNEGIVMAGWQAEQGQLVVKGFFEPTRIFKAYSSVKTQSGYFYFPVRERELWIYQREDGQFRLRKKLDLGVGVYALLEELDKRRTILGTTAGLRIIDLQSLSLENLPLPPKSLNEAQINAIIRDDQERYWIATSGGLFCWHPQKEEVYVYQVEDGLLTPQFTPDAHERDAEGRIWLGTNEGLLRFHTDSIRPHPFGPQIRIRSLLVNGNLYHSDAEIGEQRSFEFKPSVHSLDFELIALSSFWPRRNSVYFRLCGYEQAWRNLEDGAPATFTNLRPGSYTLEVYGLNANGASGETKAFPIVIRPPVWYSLWFWAGLLVVLSIGGYSGLRISNRRYAARKLLEQRKTFEQERALQQALQDERYRIAADMHDDLGAGLTSISIMLNRALTKKENTAEAYPLITKANAQANHLIENMREIIWAMNHHQDNLPDTIAHIRNYVVRILDEKAISCETFIPGEVPEIVLSGKKRRNIFLAVKEAVHNIVKHAEATRVDFFVHIGERLEITLKDNGKGCDENQIGHSGAGIRNMRRRMEDIDGTFAVEVDNGTQIELRIPLDKP